MVFFVEQLINIYFDYFILMDIFLKDGQFYLKIILFEFVELLEEEWMLELFEEIKGRGFYCWFISIFDLMLEELEVYEFVNQEDGLIVYIDG